MSHSRDFSEVHCIIQHIKTPPWSSQSRIHTYSGLCGAAYGVLFYPFSRFRDRLCLVPSCIALSITTNAALGSGSSFDFPITWLAGCLQSKADVRSRRWWARSWTLAFLYPGTLFVRFSWHASYLCKTRVNGVYWGECMEAEGVGIYSLATAFNMQRIYCSNIESQLKACTSLHFFPPQLRPRPVCRQENERDLTEFPLFMFWSSCSVKIRIKKERKKEGQSPLTGPSNSQRILLAIPRPPQLSMTRSIDEINQVRESTR